jgi:hypothetical protein
MSPSSDTTTPTAPPGPPPVRASDDDRAATVRVLQDAVARGLLTAEEGGERMAAAFAAVHLRDLPPLTADLRPAAAAAPAPRAPGWGVLTAMLLDQLRTSLSRPGTGRLHPGRVAAAVVLGLLVLVVLGSLAGELFFDGGSGHGPGGFGHR